MEQSLWFVVLSMVIAIVTLVGLGGRISVKKLEMDWPIGPKKLPIIGNLYQLAKAGDMTHVALAKLAEVHGRVMTVWLGSWRPTIVVSDYEHAWEVLVSKSSEFASRDLAFITKPITANWRTIASSNFGPYWHAIRKGLQNSALSPLNISAQSHLQESDIIQMIQRMQEEASTHGGIVKPLHNLRRTTIQVLSRVSFGHNFEDETFTKTMDALIEDTINASGLARLVDSFAFTRYIPGINHLFKKVYELKCRIEELIRPFLSPNPPQHCYLNFLISQNYPEEIIIFSIFELFLLGVDSTSSTSSWVLAFLIHNQQIQQKLYDEIKDANARNGTQIVSIAMLSKLPYLQAVVKETLRMKPIAPLAIPHKTTAETKLMGNRVAEGTNVIVNIYAIHHEPNVWPQPHKFVPERFLPSSNEPSEGERNKHLKAIEKSFIPFGAGMRTCAGMELGKLQIALVIANLINAFHWSCTSDGKLPDLSEELNFVLMMKTPLAAEISPRLL